jgi:hypothetical protein
MHAIVFNFLLNLTMFSQLYKSYNVDLEDNIEWRSGKDLKESDCNLFYPRILFEGLKEELKS